MGGGIAEVAVLHGCPTVLYDIEDSIVAAAEVRIRASVARQAQRGSIRAADVPATLGRLTVTTRLEDLGVPRSTMSCPRPGPTPSGSPSPWRRPRRRSVPFGCSRALHGGVCRRGWSGSARRHPRAGGGGGGGKKAVIRALGKETAVVRDSAGGVLPRIFAMIVNEAAFALQEEVAAAEEIDTAMRLGANYPHGPLGLAGAVGLDGGGAL